MPEYEQLSNITRMRIEACFFQNFLFIHYPLSGAIRKSAATVMS